MAELFLGLTGFFVGVGVGVGAPSFVILHRCFRRIRILLVIGIVEKLVESLLHDSARAFLGYLADLQLDLALDCLLLLFHLPLHLLIHVRLQALANEHGHQRVPNEHLAREKQDSQVGDLSALQSPLNMRHRYQSYQYLDAYLEHDADLVQQHEVVEVHPEEHAVRQDYQQVAVHEDVGQDEAEVHQAGQRKYLTEMECFLTPEVFSLPWNCYEGLATGGSFGHEFLGEGFLGMLVVVTGGLAIFTLLLILVRILDFLKAIIRAATLAVKGDDRVVFLVLLFLVISV